MSIITASRRATFRVVVDPGTHKAFINDGSGGDVSILNGTTLTVDEVVAGIGPADELGGGSGRYSGIDIGTHRVLMTQLGSHDLVAVLRDESLETIADTAGQKTTWLCTEDSTRAGIQGYITLLSEPDQTVIVSYS